MTEAFIKFSSRILDHLGVSAYDNIQKCLTELVANAYDADADEVNINLPDVISDNSYIEITDNGIGMSEKEIEEKYLFVGRFRREEGQRTPKKGRLVIGSKGIGKLAGFGIASKIQLISNKDGIQSSLILDRESFNDIKNISDQPVEIITAPTECASGVRIRLSEFNPDLHLPSPEVIRRHLQRMLPQKPDFKVWVNDVECTADDVLGERVEFNQSIEGLGIVKGFYIIANARQLHHGLAIRVRDRIVTEPSLFGLDTKTHGFFTAEKIVGEIKAEFLDPEDNYDKKKELINISRDGFLEDSPIVRELNEWAKNFLEEIIRGVDSTETTKRTDALLNRPSIKERLERMPAHVRGTATSVVKGIIIRIKNVNDDEAADLIEWILRYYESNILRELMRAIIAADVREAERLAQLIQEWGLKQVNSVTEIIKTQIQIIGKLEELISSNQAKEIELHKLIENNLWLIRQGLELWSSDKPLKKVLDNHIDIAYKDRQSIRPDLICRSRNDGFEAIIIEFKKPSEKVIMAHVTQAMEYEEIIRHHRPRIVFETFVVGREYDSSVISARTRLEKAGLFMWSFEEILQGARMRFEKILEILGQDT